MCDPFPSVHRPLFLGTSLSPYPFINFMFLLSVSIKQYMFSKDFMSLRGKSYTLRFLYMRKVQINTILVQSSLTDVTVCRESKCPTQISYKCGDTRVRNTMFLRGCDGVLSEPPLLICRITTRGLMRNELRVHSKEYYNGTFPQGLVY